MAKIAERPDPHSFLPVKPVDFLVLMVLLDGERHGYGIVQDIRNRTEGRVRLVPGNFYAVLRRLMQAGLLTRTSKEPAAPRLRERRYYRITRLGRDVAAAEAERLRALVQEAEARHLIEALETR